MVSGYLDFLNRKIKPGYNLPGLFFFEGSIGDAACYLVLPFFLLVSHFSASATVEKTDAGNERLTASSSANFIELSLAFTST